jgi:catechol-2,3-dioxygenase
MTKSGNEIETVKPYELLPHLLAVCSCSMKFRKIIEISIYSSDLEKMKEFYVDKLGLEFASEQRGRHVFLKTDKICFLFSIIQ